MLEEKTGPYLEGSLEDEAGQLIAKASATARRIAFAPR